MGKVKFVSPSGKVIWMGEKALSSTSLRTMGYKPYDEVYAEVHQEPAPKQVLEPITTPVSEKTHDEKPKRGRPRKNTMSDADQA